MGDVLDCVRFLPLAFLATWRFIFFNVLGLKLGTKPRLHAAFETHGLGLAELDERAGVAAAGFILGVGSLAGIDHSVQGGGGFCDKLAERRIKFYGRPSPVFAVKKAAAGNRHPEHFLQTQCLGAELDFIGAVRLRRAALVFHRHHKAVFMKFHDVALPGNPQLQRAHRQAASDPHASFCFIRSFVRLVMQDLPLGSEFVLRPDLLQMD